MQEGKKVPLREDIPAESRWRIEDLYESDEQWEKDFDILTQMTTAFVNFRGRLGSSAEWLDACLSAQDEMNMMLEKVYVYAGQKNHEDMGNGRYQQLAMRAQNMAADVANAAAFVEPELLMIPEEDLECFYEQKPELALYRRYIDEKRRMKEHILSPEMESVLAQASRLGQAPQNIFQVFQNADLDFGFITGENGEAVHLTHGRYIQLLESQDRRVRKEAFETFYRAYDAHKNTLAATFEANVQQELFFAKMRRYDSSLAAALDVNHIPLSVYDELIEAVHRHLPAMHAYVSLRKRLLGVEQLHMYDVYVPLAAPSETQYTFEEAKEIVKKALAPLGEDYLTVLQEGFDGGWIDVYENKGKRSGAYSWGAYGTHPYVLMNFNGSLNSVFTLAHEMGHAIHSYYSDKTQPYPYAGYCIFVAEVASTCNEALLIRYLLDHAENGNEKNYLINYFLDQFRATVYRQTMFAEFEQKVHALAQNGESLSTDLLCAVYEKLNRDYFGPDMVTDREIAMEWARIPHFYTAFYVYQYATGFAAAIAISSRILKGEQGIVDKYRKFLSGGSREDPIDLLKICGIDMTTPEPVEEALAVFEDYLHQLS